jgi:hypothetical protein
VSAAAVSATVAAAFFADPPWRGGAPRYKVGLNPVELTDWLPDAASPADIERKLQLYRSCFQNVVSETPTGARFVPAFTDLLRTFCDERGMPTPAAGFGSLADAALWVPDDLCLMVQTDGLWRLEAASLCAPSFWTLRDKMGACLSGLHAGHQGLNQLLGDRMQAVFDRLPLGRVLERRNWFLHGPSGYFEPHDREIAAPAAIGDCLIRTERQTLRRLDDRCIVFTIRVRLLPFALIVDYPAAAADMAKTVRALTDAERLAFSMRHRTGELLHYLDRIGTAEEH